MYEWLTTDFNIFGFYIFRFLRVNIADGTFFTWLFLIAISVMVTKTLWKMGLIQFAYKVIKFFINLTIKTIKLACKLIIIAYSLVLLYLQVKRQQIAMSEYWAKRSINTLGVTFRHVSGADDLIISHPKYILKVINLIKSAKIKFEDTVLKVSSFIIK